MIEPDRGAHDQQSVSRARELAVGRDGRLPLSELFAYLAPLAIVSHRLVVLVLVLLRVVIVLLRVVIVLLRVVIVDSQLGSGSVGVCVGRSHRGRARAA
jgi:hypothetical protein